MRGGVGGMMGMVRRGGRGGGNMNHPHRGGGGRQSIRGGGGAGGPPPSLTSSGRVPFDITFFEEIFPRLAEQDISGSDTELNNAILKRHSDISPSAEELQQIQNMVTRVQGILETLILTPGTFDACQVEEVRQVGSFKQGTILASHKTADFVVILKTLPTREAVDSLCNRVSEDLRQSECIRPSPTVRGFDISSLQATVRIFVTTVPPNFRKLDPELHLDQKLMNEAWQAIRHCRWFEENAHNSSIKVLIRILRDMRQRFTGLTPLAPWMLDLLGHHAATNNVMRTVHPVPVAFRRCLALMSAGMYLPGYSGNNVRGHNLTCEEQDSVTATAQTLLRILGHGGYKEILGIEPLYNDILTTPTVINGIIIKNPEKISFDQESEEARFEDEDESGDYDEEANGGGGMDSNQDALL